MTTAKPKKPAKSPTKSPRSEKAEGEKKPTKASQMLAMVQRPEGASVAELVAEFGVQPHSARAVVSVESRKQGIKVASVDGRIVVIE